MIPKTLRTEVTTIRFTAENYTAIEQAAYDSHRTISNWVEVACMWALENDIVAKVPRPKR